MIRWCGEDLPFEAAKFHFLLAGATGSGKTALLRILMQSVLAGGNVPPKAIVYDPKQDFVPVVHGILGARSPMTGPLDLYACILNPFDSRSVAWDIAADTTNPASARQVAATLVPEDPHSASPFFTRAAQDIAFGVILAFIESGVEWDFRDLVLALTLDPALTRKILEFSTSNANRVHSYFSESSETNLSVWSTLQTKIGPYEPIAAGFHHSRESISLREWLHSDDRRVLILRTNQAVREAIDSLNAVLFRRLAEFILDMPDQTEIAPEDRIWVFLDEVREAGRLDGLRSLLNMGRSKGATVVLSFQDIEGLKAVYGEHEALELTGQCGNKALLRLESPATAEWTSSLFGLERIVTTDRSSGIQSGSGAQVSSGESSRQVDRAKILPSDFLTLPNAGLAEGLHGFGKRFDQGLPIRFHAKPFPSIDPRNEPGDRRRRKVWEPSIVDAVWQRPDHELFLHPWKPEDLKRLGLKAVVPPRRPRS